MKALVIRGKYKDEKVEIHQWSNDWFTLNTGDHEMDSKVFYPTSLAFRAADMDTIRDSKNNGFLFEVFEQSFKIYGDGYNWTFKLKGENFKRRKRIIPPEEIKSNYFHSKERGCEFKNRRIQSYDRHDSIDGKYCLTHQAECCKCGWEFGHHYGNDSLKLA